MEEEEDEGDALELTERQNKAAQAYMERVMKFKQAVLQRKTFLAPSLMK